MKLLKNFSQITQNLLLKNGVMLVALLSTGISGVLLHHPTYGSSSMTENSAQKGIGVQPKPGSDTLAVNLSSMTPAIPRDVITLLYRKEEAKAPARLAPASLATTAAIERELLNRNYKIPPTSPNLLAKIDRSPNIIVCFAPDAGLSMTYSIYKNVRQGPGANTYAAEVSIRARVAVGAGILSLEQGRGTVRFRRTGQTLEYGERRAMEQAAGRAAASLVRSLDARIKNLTDEQIDEYAKLNEAEAFVSEASIIPPPSGAQPLATPAKIYPLIIGVSDYSYASRLNKRKIQSLRGVALDVQNIAQTFVKRGIPEKQIRVLMDEDATTAKVKAEIASIAQIAGPDDLLILYVSGHGMQANNKREGKSLPVFYDFSLKQAHSAPDFSQLLELLTQSAADRFVMIVDTCHAGGAASIMPTVVITSNGVQLSKSGGSPSPHTITRELDTTRNIAILSSSRFEEVSHEFKKTGGLFTYFLSQAIQEAEKDEILRDIVKKRVAEPVIQISKEMCSKKKCPAPQQTPVLGFSGGGDMIRL